MQEILVISMIFISLAYLGWQFYRRFFKKESGCESCAFNPVDDKGKEAGEKS